MTKDLILKSTGAADLVSKNDLIALIYPYKPYIQSTNDTLELDSYYVAANRAYNKAKNANIGKLTNDINIKSFLVECGMKMGKSTLILHPEFGSYFLVQAVKVEGGIGCNDIKTPDLLCDSCNRCTAACPGNAIQDQAFTRTRCIRNMMDLPITEHTLPYLGSSLLGCQTCRKVCPHNTHIQYDPIPNELAEHLKLETILKFENDTRTVLKSYIGDNMARASMLLPTAMSIALKRRRFDLIHLIKPLTKHPSSKVSQSAAIVLDTFEKSY